MESFGKVEAFAETLVSGLDRSWQRPPGVAAKLIDCKATNGFYYIEYTLQNPGKSRKHLFSALGMAFNGWYNRLYTVTGQFLDEESEKYGSAIRKIVSSFRFI
uniref:PsbP C-terminal domain-containing protein n=1 Tax=Rhizophora mucronata TaxID=61149 RepID=A0A2P2LF25_RHIMU